MNILNGIDAADRRIREQSRIAGRYTRMSNAAASGISHTADTPPPAPPNEHEEDIHNSDEALNEPAKAPPGENADAADDNISHAQPPDNKDNDNDDDCFDILGHAAGQIAAALNTDGERLLILALIVILGSEGADIALLAALAYLII